MKPYGIKGKKGPDWPLSGTNKSKKTARQFAKKLIESQRDIDPEIARVVQKRFWDMV